MSTRTITVTEDAYEALKSLKAVNESFSETILRVAKRKPLSEFYGTWSKETANKVEKNIREARQLHRNLHEKRVQKIDKELQS